MASHVYEIEVNWWVCCYL